MYLSKRKQIVDLGKVKDHFNIQFFFSNEKTTTKNARDKSKKWQVYPQIIGDQNCTHKNYF